MKRGRQKGIPAWNKGLPKEQQPRFGKTHSLETRAKISESEKGKFVSEETRIKIGRSYIKTESRAKQLAGINARKGEDSPNWIVDRSKVVGRHTRVNDPCYKQWKYQVFNRDNFKCKIANQDCDGRVEAHHILGWSLYQELRYKVNNGITLCHAHHPRTRAKEKQLIPFFNGLVSVSKD